MLINEITCPECGMPPTHNMTRFGMRSSCEACGLWSWDFKPLVSGATHEARKRAHKVFDALWKNKHLTRSQAYKKLSDMLNIPPDECHISMFDASTCNRVVECSRLIFFDLYKKEREK